MTETRRAYKDSVFRRLFGDPENRDALLSLYNALNGTNYTDPEQLEINTIEDVVYMGMKNDISCIIDCRMVLFEHQSTYNPNMPLRGLMYFSKLYDQYVETSRKSIYSSRLIKIPTPRYFVLYNGRKEAADKTLLRLSDAFIRPDESGNFQWTAEMININRGHNHKLLESCRLLSEYVQFVDRVEDFRKKNYSTDEAVKAAVDECIRDNILRSFLLKHKSEVIDMCITEYNERKTMTLFYEEGIEKGIEQGIELGIEQGIEQGIELGIEQGIEKGIVQGIEQGIAQGIGQGIEQGIEKERNASLKNLMEALQIPLDEAMRLLKIPTADKDRYL